jgi:hypothetical protein
MVRIDMFFFFNIIRAILHIASKVRMVKEFVISLPDCLTPAFLAISKKNSKEKPLEGSQVTTPPQKNHDSEFCQKGPTLGSFLAAQVCMDNTDMVTL